MILLALPTYNEEACLGALLERVAEVAPRVPGLQVVVVDDGSTDGSLDVARAFTTRLRLTSVQHPRNLGLGAALRTAIREFQARAVDGDILITMDADDSHSPDLIPEMVARIQQGCDVVIASRFVPGATVTGVHLARRLLSEGLKCVARVLFPIPHVKDYSSGYRAYSADYLLPIVRRFGIGQLIRENDFSAMPEFLLRLYLANDSLRAVEVPLTLRYDRKKSASKMKVFRNVRKVIGLLIRLRFARS
jgi:dolichol-phosphate mannosyltransferase